MEEELKRIGRQARRRPIRPVRLRGNFPSQVERLPELTSPAVLEEIFSEAFRKTAARAEALRAGALTEDDIRAADSRLVNWLEDTLSGGDPAFGTTENWNPERLEAYLWKNFSGQLGLGPRPEASAIRAASELFVRSLWREIQACGGVVPPEKASDLISGWAALFSGAPVSR